MRPTLFLPMKNFFPSRHRTFIETLHAHFSLVVHEGEAWSFQGGDVSDTRFLNRQIGNVDRLNEFELHWNQYMQYVTTQLTSISGSPPSAEILDAHFQAAKPVVTESLKCSLLLGELVKEKKIAAVVTGADYTQYARPFVYMAAQLNIPTVHIEHGLFALEPYPEIFRHEPPSLPFASNYVILDNALETNIFSRYPRQSSVRELLPLGCPIDNSVSGSPMSMSSGKRKLHISPEKKCVTLVMSWNEPKTPGAPVLYQADEVEFVEMIFRSMLQAKHRKDIHIIIKFHPAVRDFQESHGMRLFYSNLASEYGLSHDVSIVTENLEETIASSNLVVSWRRSSVLWDAIMQNTPVALALPARQREIYVDDDWSSHSAVSSAGLSAYIRNQQEAVEIFDRMFEPTEQYAFEQRVAEFKEKWNIFHRTASEKSAAIAQWLTGLIRDDDTSVY
ncbi:MAG: hypothetical protein JXX29_22320 [Deltaproteobacteria bacterium]|nr:hypothetical protein [Deltaproteobacteria bacterium]MBN2674433.1 hypothetical protein [Deltaproteobacteria bacterium]